MSSENIAVDVVLTDELMKRIRAEALELGIPVEWLAASLIVDTVDANFEASVAVPHSARRVTSRQVA